MISSSTPAPNSNCWPLNGVARVDAVILLAGGLTCVATRALSRSWFSSRTRSDWRDVIAWSTCHRRNASGPVNGRPQAGQSGAGLPRLLLQDGQWI
ncbi:MAG TPA: hypothetical protein VFJ97_10670 [Dermatophilaceae bacterium]|nr:hypothetical protein [Dermatophilaceae bacterium]